MKKYLMTGIAALALGGIITSCSHDMDQYKGGNTTENIKKTYENAFVETFGQPAATQTWGFGSATVAGTRGGTRANPGENYPATHSYQDASGAVIAGANMNHNEWADPSKEFGGWVVPDALTEGQKLRVQKYFQANPNLAYEDPHFRHFFIQQVYTGGTNPPETGNKESTKAANGQVHAGSNLNQLTVGEACSHINDFNAGTCSKSNVLDNGTTVNNGTYHEDQITLMVNVYDTSCFGYHETGGSNVKGVINHNDKMALVSAAVIDSWAAANGNPGEAVVDKWNRSFMGFDYELLPEEDIIPDNPTYAKFTDVPAYNNIQYAWDGTNVIEIKATPEASEAEEVDITATFAQNAQGNNATCAYDNGKIVCNFNGQWYSSVAFQQNADWSSYSKLVIEFDGESTVNGTLNGVNASTNFAVGSTSAEVACSGNYPYISITTGNNDHSMGTLTIKKVTLVKEAYTPDASVTYYDPNGYLLGDDNKIMFYSSSNTNQYGGTIIDLSENDMKTSQEGKTCLNLVKFKELADGGYHPIRTDLKKWVKWEAACDGYYSDWIVTLTEAKRISSGDGGDDGDDDDENDEIEKVRIIAEDLTLSDYGKDFDFNDAVFDVIWNKTKGTVSIKVLAAGGELTMYIGGTAAGVDSVKTVNELFKEANPDENITEKTMINTAPGRHTEYKSFKLPLEKDWWSGNTIGQIAKSIYIRVMKSGELITLSADQGKAASKIAVGTDYEWCDEREDVDDKFGGKFSEYVGGAHSWNTWYK